MSEPRTIKKYPNRRLYDTVESRYITLADIRRLVIDRIDFVVMDKKTQEDITRFLRWMVRQVDVRIVDYGVAVFSCSCL